MQDGLGRRLTASARALPERYDTVLFDLDGVVYVGPDPVPGAPEVVDAARVAGMHPAFVTNNASRTPADVAKHLRELGVHAETSDVVTSAQAAARMVRDRVPAGSTVLTVGGDGLVDALAEHGLRAVRSADDGPAAVVQGFDREVGWRALAEAVVAVDAGLPWVASNLDATFPTPRGRAPGNGQLVAVVARTTGRSPAVAGKPERALFEETLLRVGGDHPLVVGDRLDTDIKGAQACGIDSLLVLTGVTEVAEVCFAASDTRPTYVATDLRGLLAEHPEVRVDTSEVSASCRGWVCHVEETSRRDGTRVSLEGDGERDDALRALVSACWARLDLSGEPVGGDAVRAAWRAAGA